MQPNCCNCNCNCNCLLVGHAALAYGVKKANGGPDKGRQLPLAPATDGWKCLFIVTALRPENTHPMNAREQRRKPMRRKSAGSRFLRAIMTWVLAATILAVLLVVAAVAFTMSSLPTFHEMMKSPQGQSVVIRAEDGTELVNIGPSYGRWLPYAETPQTMIEAMKAVEDRRFDWHPGIDPIGIVRSFVVNFRAGRRVQGASTITQQLARNIFLTNTRSFNRKIREQILALAIERKFTKQQIMELYLNRVYFGGGAYGIDAASRRFYGHPASELSVEEAAIIAGLVKAPSRYAPTADPERARSRARVVIETMRESGAISRRAAEAADVSSVRFAVDRRQGDVRYYTDWILTQLDTLTDEADEPIEVFTTLIPAHQTAAEEAIHAEQLAGTQAALVAMQSDGAVTALVGGREYATSIYNRATVARRQPGSAWKIFDYLVALENGMKPTDQVVDEPLRIGNWSPKNSNGRNLGPMAMRQAFALSVNTVAVQLAARYGFSQVKSMARRFGITTPISTQPAMALGSSEVTLFELTRAYAAIANNGVEVRPWGIQRITTASGRTLYNHEAETPRVLVAPFIAAWMTDMMRATVESGTGRAAQFGRPVAGKTGTSSANKDGWFIGFTPELTAGVWVGRDDNRSVSGLAGGQAPARMFKAFMGKALSGTPITNLTDKVEVPSFGIEPDQEAYGITPGGELFPSTQETINPGTLDPSLAPDRAENTARREPANDSGLSDAWLERITSGIDSN